MILTVRGKDFAIDFVSNYVHERYSELTALAIDIQETKDLSTVEAALKDGDAKKAREAARELDKRRGEIIQRIVSIREDILKELLDGNGIEFDAEWWSRKTAVDDVNDFIYESVMKDTHKSSVVKKN